ncbi:MAG: DUF4835 family protein [Flavobacteriaceae bacterium]|nr:DUF4835 family protein [Flavobacteriaceae bacterium]MCY4253398.1 DUF4835 family protein [Flavobacteriaceae bacterium]
MIRYFFFSLSFLGLSLHSYTQELRATVVVNSLLTEQTNSRIFQELEARVSNFLNTQRFSDQTVLIQEKVHCNFVFIIEDFRNNQFSGTLQVQSFRPIYGAGYSSPVFSNLDQDIQFEFQNQVPLRYSADNYTSELMAILSFYSHLILAYDLDTFSATGGQFHLRQARYIQRLARSQGQNGWFPQPSKRNRYQLIQELDTQVGQEFRAKALYQYHRNVLDQLVDNPNRGLNQLFDIILDFEDIFKINSRLMLFQLLIDAKNQEIYQILSRGNIPIPESVVESLNRIFPSYSQLWNNL